MIGPLPRSRSCGAYRPDYGASNNAHRGHWGRSAATARLRFRMDKPFRCPHALSSPSRSSPAPSSSREPDAHSFCRRRTGADAGESIAVGSGPDHDARRSVGAVADRLQLRHRAGARRSQPAARARHRQPAVHGHRRNRQSRDGALPIADRTVAGQRARAELRIRPARSRQAAAQVRRPRSHADAQPPGRRHDAAGRSESARSSATTPARCGRSATRSSPASAPITSASRSCPIRSTRARR